MLQISIHGCHSLQNVQANIYKNGVEKLKRSRISFFFKKNAPR